MSKFPFIIAEIGSNHNGDMDLCKRIIDAAKEAGADAVKFQSFDNKSLISEAEYKRRTNYGDSTADRKKHFGTLKEMVDAYYFRPDQHDHIAEYCRQIGIEFFSTPFAKQEADMLERLNVKRYKIASMDVNHPTLLQYVASKGKPMILSTGMATLGEIENAVNILEKSGAKDITILHCTSVYPPALEDFNLNNIVGFREALEYPIGYSDHSIGTDIPLIAFSLGATMLEKHFTVDKELPGWDHAISANPAELKTIVEYSRMSREELQDRAKKVTDYARILGRKRRILSEGELKKIPIMRRCVVAAHPMKAGHIVTMSDLNYKRPGNGIRPDEASYVVGRALTRDVPYDHEFVWSDFGMM